MRARLTESIMYHPDHFISVILCQFRVSPLTRLMLWVCFNSWTFMLAELLAKLLAGCCNSPRLANWQAVACANEAQRASREFAKLLVILAQERNDC